MAMSARDSILNKIRSALKQSVPAPYPTVRDKVVMLPAAPSDISSLFAHQFEALQGHFFFCEDKTAMHQQLKNLMQEKQWKHIFCAAPFLQDQWPSMDIIPYESLATCDVSITGCENLVARTGTIVLSAALPQGRTASVYAPAHVCIAYTDQLVYDLPDVLQPLAEKHNQNLPSLISFASGPSRTADIEKTLVTGVHGPKEVYCFLIKRG